MDAPLKPLSEYGISEEIGFLPPFMPSQRLPEYFNPWEKIIDDLPELICNKQIRGEVEALPKLEVSDKTLHTEADWWRAYVVATFIGQAYVWMDQIKMMRMSNRLS